MHVISVHRAGLKQKRKLKYGMWSQSHYLLSPTEFPIYYSVLTGSDREGVADRLLCSDPLLPTASLTLSS